MSRSPQWSLSLRFPHQDPIHPPSPHPYAPHAQPISLTKQIRCTNFSIYFWNKTLHVSVSSSVHHQEFVTVHTALVYAIQFASRIRTDLQFRPDPARKLSVELLQHLLALHPYTSASLCNTCLEFSRLLGCYAVWIGKYLPTFRKIVKNPHSVSFSPRTDVKPFDPEEEGITILRKSSCLYRASNMIKAHYYPTDAQIYNS